MEQLNMVGKRSGDGIVTHRATMVNVLSRGVADRLLLMDFTIGRKGLLNYIRSLAGSNIVKIVPGSNGNASDERVDGKQRLKVVCGAFQSYLDDEAWISEKTGHSVAEVRFCAENTITPNVGNAELGEAIAKVLPFTEDDPKNGRPVLQCLLFRAVNGKLQIVGANGFILGDCVLDFDAGNGEEVSVLVNRANLKAMPSVLRKAKRVNVRIGKAGDTLDGMALFIDTDIARHTFVGEGGEFPNYEQVVPKEFSCTAHLDAQEALKAVRSLKATATNPKDFSLDLTFGNGLLMITNVDEVGAVAVKADGSGEGFIRLNGEYVSTALRSVNGMVDINLSTAYAPILVTSNGFRAVVMPMSSPKAVAQQRADTGAAEPIEAEVEEIKPEDIEAGAIEAIEAELDGEQPEAELDGEQPEAEASAMALAEAIKAEAEEPKRSGRGVSNRKRQSVAA